MNTAPKLPKLPPVDGYDKRVEGHYSAETLQAYATQAIADHIAALAPPSGEGVKWFPLLGTPFAIRRSMLNEEQAQRNHSQSLDRLAQRGGLDPAEAHAIVKREAFRSMKDRESFAELIAAMPATPQSAPVDGDGWPDYLMLRDTKLHDNMGGLGQRIFTTAGAGYKKVKYVRVDLATTPPPASQERGGEVEKWHEWLRHALDRWPEAKTALIATASAMGPAGKIDESDIKWANEVLSASPPSSAPPSYCPHCGQRDDGVLACCERYMEPPSSAAEEPKVIDLQAAHLESLRENLRHQDDGMSAFFDDAAEQAKPVAYTECTRDCDCVGECKAGLEKPLAEQAQAGESREARMVVVERDGHGKPTVWCDPEIVDLVTALNAAGIRTVASCSGHGEQHGNIALADGRELIIVSSFEAARKMEAQAGELPPLPEAAGMAEFGRAFTADQMREYRLAGGVTVDDAMVRRALDGQDAYWDDDALYVTCERCDGKGHHGGFGEGGHDQDWCETCGGPGSINIGTEAGAMRAALVAALGAKDD